MKYSYIKKYSKHINANLDITNLKDWASAKKILKHLLDNTHRFNEPELINQERTKLNKFIPVRKNGVNVYSSIDDIMKDMDEALKLNPPNNKTRGQAPFRFITMSINLDPADRNNDEVIKDWIKRTYNNLKDKMNICGICLHMNETAPHITFIQKNYLVKDKKVVYGNFVGDKQVKLSGTDGRVLTKKLWRQQEQTMSELCKDYGLTYKQSPTGEKSQNRIISAFRRTLEKMDDVNWKPTKKDRYNIKAFLGCDDKDVMKLKKALGIDLLNSHKAYYEYFNNIDISIDGVNQAKEQAKHSALVEASKDIDNRIKRLCNSNGWPVEDWEKEYEAQHTVSQTKAQYFIERISENVDEVMDKNETLTETNKKLKEENQSKTIIKKVKVPVEKIKEVKVEVDKPETLQKIRDLKQEITVLNQSKTKTDQSLDKLKQVLGFDKRHTIDDMVKTFEDIKKQEKAQKRSGPTR